MVHTKTTNSSNNGASSSAPSSNQAKTLLNYLLAP
jgi:hypothetical protein